MTNAELKSDNLTSGQPKRRLSGLLEAFMPLTFRRRAMLFLVPMIAIVSMVYTLESISTERKILRNEIIKKGATIAAITARNAELPLLSENLEQLKNSALPVMAIEDVAFVSFLNKRSETQLHAGKPQPLDETLTATTDQTVSFHEHDDVFEFIVPVVTVKAAEGLFLLEGSESSPTVREQIGWVRIGLLKEVMGRAERQIIIRGGGAGTAFFHCRGGTALYLHNPGHAPSLCPDQRGNRDPGGRTSRG
ncbi:MAG: integral membrane sensor hybrid histidine kinase [uncultured bacterium]|nr:MAG: integral membrane sensor hybrid histidine kinase [uncultured bacterium]